jgi:NAD(P)-dependent dehydrogenase (short-subunit alcohol dehydrogenase family)
MAGVVLMLVSEAGSYVNGECITVDGGLTATRL